MLAQPVIILIYVVVIFVLYVLITGMIYNPERMGIDAVIKMKKKFANDENYGAIMDRTKSYYQAKITKIMIWKGIIFSGLIISMIYLLPLDMTITTSKVEQKNNNGETKEDFIKII